MTSPDLVEMALGLLPPLPHDVTCLRDDGGQMRLSLIEQRDGHLYGQLSLLTAATGLGLTIPVQTSDGGGYSIGCRVEQLFFMGGLESAAKLSVTEIRRRKPYRVKDRIKTDAIATLYVVSSDRQDFAAPLHARVLDISASGIGLAIEGPLDIGDRLRVETGICGIGIHGEATVVQTGRTAFGRWRVGCQFTRLPLHTEHQIEQLAQSLDQRAA